MNLCPHCGFDLLSFRAIEFGNIGITDAGDIVFEGRPMRLTRTQYDIITALVRARGRGVTRGTLANLVQGDVNDQTVVKYIERVRNVFRLFKPDFDQVECIYGFSSYRWAFRS